MDGVRFVLAVWDRQTDEGTLFQGMYHVERGDQSCGSVKGKLGKERETGQEAQVNV